MDNEPAFPYAAWRLTPAFKPKQGMVASTYSSDHPQWRLTDTGVQFHIASLFLTQEEALQDGLRQLAGQQAKLDKMQANLDKRKTALGKAALALTA
jgi:hypothetical protein